MATRLVLKVAAPRGSPSTGSPSTERRKARGKIREPAVPPIPEGFEQWDSNTKLVSGRHLTEAQYNITSSEYVQDVSVRHKEAFLIRPLTITTGPLQGRHILLLEPVAPPAKYFRFMGLPVELRRMVYDYVLIENRDVTMSTVKPIYHPRRPVVEGFELRHKGSRTMKWDQATRKWIGQPLSAFTLLGVCKQIYFEALTTAYGDHMFKFSSIRDAGVFLDTIGQAARGRLRNLHFTDYEQSSLKAATFTRLLATDCMSLRAIIVPHYTICQDSHDPTLSIHTIANACEAAMHNIRVLRKRKYGTPFDVLGLMQLASSGDHCNGDQALGTTACRTHERCRIKCKDALQHDAELRERLRASLKPRFAHLAIQHGTKLLKG
ncbi:hypothetical protein Tdes44962_MAKER04285 [Teratosphaeria destructans]|uniref:DUF7730 domain-containing protein n=1 Tax=Teratosphaeria destructans TaxID=418781 RepID=A0A9W7SMI9_9PEZI|nr:hypothetical protein Tdes44962_MAKER04285 [Teratosphaeria destructans]